MRFYLFYFLGQAVKYVLVPVALVLGPIAEFLTLPVEESIGRPAVAFLDRLLWKYHIWLTVKTGRPLGFEKADETLDALCIEFVSNLRYNHFLIYEDVKKGTKQYKEVDQKVKAAKRRNGEILEKHEEDLLKYLQPYFPFLEGNWQAFYYYELHRARRSMLAHLVFQRRVVR